MTDGTTPPNGSESDVDALVMPNSGSAIIGIDWLNKFEILVIYTADAFQEFIEENGIQDTEYANLWQEGNGGVDVIHYKGIPYLILTLSSQERRVVIHECIHTSHFVMDAKGIPINLENSEVMAYLADFICERVFEEIGA